MVPFWCRVFVFLRSVLLLLSRLLAAFLVLEVFPFCAALNYTATGVSAAAYIVGGVCGVRFARGVCVCFVRVEMQDGCIRKGEIVRDVLNLLTIRVKWAKNNTLAPPSSLF